MSKELYDKAFSLMNSGEFKDAYEAFSSIYEENNKEYEALYLRSLIDFAHLKANFKKTIADFEFLSSFNNKFKYASMHLLSVYYDMTDNFEKVIELGELVKEHFIKNNKDPKFLIDVYFLLARAYYHRYTHNDTNIALDYINECIKLSSDDEDIDYYLFKIDCLIALKKYDEASLQISELQTTFSVNSSLYFAKEKLSYSIAKDYLSDNKIDEAVKYFNEALEYLDFCEKYSGDPNYIGFARVEILSYLKEYEKALEVLNEMENQDNVEDVLIEKIKIYENLSQLDEAITICKNYLENNNSWKIKYSLAHLLTYQAQTIDEYNTIRNLYLDSYVKYPKEFILYDLYDINEKIENHNENYDLLIKHFNINKNNGKLAYLISRTSSILNKSYDEQYEYLLKSYEFDYLNEIEFLDEGVFISSNPSSHYKRVIAHKNDSYNSLSPYSIRKMGQRYLYGECGFKVNYHFAKEYIKKAFQLLPKTPCAVTLLGRYYEFTNDVNNAINYYQHAYKLYQEEVDPICNCACGYLAHCYFTGYGVKKDIAKAKEIIKDAVNNSGKKSSNIVIYLYAYFALNDEEDFKLDVALDLLDGNTYSFRRYEISKLIILKQVKEKLYNKDLSHDKLLNDEFKLCLKHNDKEVKKYYKENVNKKISYPYFKDF